MTDILYAKQRIDPDEFQVMIGNVEPSLANFFDQLYIGGLTHITKAILLIQKIDDV